MGGMFGESKYDILKKLPTHLVPKSALVRHPSTKAQILSTIEKNGLRFPLIFKPDIGERGFRVERINSAAEVEGYRLKMNSDFIIQELVDLPLEYGIFYTRFPQQEKGTRS